MHTNLDNELDQHQAPTPWYAYALGILFALIMAHMIASFIWGGEVIDEKTAEVIGMVIN